MTLASDPTLYIIDPITGDTLGTIDLPAKLAVKRRYRGFDSIELTVEWARLYANQLRNGRILYAPEVDPDASLGFRIEHVEHVKDASRNQLVVTGRTRDGTAMGERRAWPDPANYPLDTQGYDEQTAVPAETALKHYVDLNAGPSAVASRQLPNFVVAADGATGIDVTVAARYQPVLDISLEIVSPADMGWNVTFDGTDDTFDVITPTDRSASVFWDFEFDTLTGWSDEASLVGSKSVAVVAGQGEGIYREVVIRPENEPTGDDRRETFVDARDVPLFSTAVLQQRGDAVLAQTGIQSSVEVEPRQFGSFEYARDWHLGDRVTARNAELESEAFDPEAFDWPAFDMAPYMVSVQIVEVWLTFEGSRVPTVTAVVDKPGAHRAITGGTADSGNPGTVINGTSTVSVGPGGLAVTEGAITVTNAGAVVIIDGTSDMFKIVATGTLTHSQGPDSAGSTTQAISGTGLPDQTPAFLAFLTEGATPASSETRTIGSYHHPRSTDSNWAAPTSGVAAVNYFWASDRYFVAYAGTSGGNPAISLKISNAHPTDTFDAHIRWYLLKEAAI